MHAANPNDTTSQFIMAGLSEVFQGGEEEDEQEQARRDFAAYQQEQATGFACPTSFLSSPHTSPSLTATPASSLVAPITLAASRLVISSESSAMDSMEVESVDQEAISTNGHGGGGKVDILKETGNAKAEAGDFGAALLLWEEAINLSPRNAILYELKVSKMTPPTILCVSGPFFSCKELIYHDVYCCCLVAPPSLSSHMQAQAHMQVSF